MAPPVRARFLSATGAISIPGARDFSLLFGEDANLHALVADLTEVSLVSLASAVNRFRGSIDERYLWMYFYAQEPESFEPSVSPREPFNFEFFGDRLRVRAQYLTAGEDATSYPTTHQVVTPLLQRHRARVIRTSHQNEFGQIRAFVEYEYRSLRGLRVGDARRLADEVAALASAVSTCGALDAKAIEQLVIAGRADLLVGQHEHQTFDAKSAPYSLSTAEGQYELAKDVASFANSANGGLIVCGLRTHKVLGSDVIREAKPVPLAGVTPRSWVRAVRRLVIPAPEGLHVRIHRVGGSSGYVLVSVPPQPEHVKPFLVATGRRSSGRLVETDITVPIRIGEDIEYSDAAALHGTLTAGRVALRQPN